MVKPLLKYFKIAKDLNEKYHEELIIKKLHFRGNLNSFSLISVNQHSPELGIANRLTSIENATKKLKNYNEELVYPKRRTEEKNLQAYIINHAMEHQGVLPFGNFIFITSELAIKIDNNNRIVNDILAIDSLNNLAIIELKSSRSNKVKIQTIDFENKVVKTQANFIKELVSTMSGITWNGKVRKIAVWSAPKNKLSKRKNKFDNIELYNYTFEGIKTENRIIMNKVVFSKE